MALPTSQYVRRHYVTVPVAAWGAASTHAHNLNSGQGTGYTPNLAFVNKAYIVDAGGVLHPVNPAIARVSAVDATNVSVVVGETAAGAPQLVAALAAVLGGLPVSAVLEVNTRFAHSQEIGVQAVADESIGLPVTIGLPIELLDYSTPAPAVETVYVRTTGADTNDGRTVGTAWLTLQKAFDYLVSISPLRHFVLVDVGAGTFGGNLNWDGIDCSMGYTFHVIGNQPVATPAVGDFRRLTIAGAVVGLVSAHDDGHLRFTPNAGDSWVNPAGAGTALADTEIGKVVYIHDATHSCYATVGNVDTTAAGLGAYIDITVDGLLTAVLPAWVTAVGTIWDIIGWADPSWTIFSGVLAGQNLRTGTGSATMASGTVSDRYCSFAFIQFTSAFVAVGPTFEGCDRLAFPGCRFVKATQWAKTLAGDAAVNTVPQLLDGLFFWPAAIWTRMGFTGVSTDLAWGGLGTAIEHNATFGAFAGSLSGWVWTRSGGSFAPQARSNLTLSWCSFGPDTPATSTLDVSGGSHCTLSYMKMESQIRIRMPDSVCRLNDHVSWLSRALAGANAPLAGTPATHVSLAGGLMRVSLGGTMVVNASAGSFYEGINSDNDPTNVVVLLDQLARYIDLESAHKGTFFGCKGWLSASMGFAWFSRGALSTWHWPAKPNALGAAPDIFLDHHAIMKVHPNVGITKDAVDTTPGTGVYVDHDSQFLHGDPANHTPDFIWGVTPGAGLSVGAGAVFDILNGGVVEVGNLKANVAAGQLVMREHFRSHILYGSDAASYVLANSAAATEKIIGGLAAAAGHAVGALVLLNDDFDVVLGTREGCTERSV